MLENLLATKLKKKLLSIFFAFPKRSFSLLELRNLTEVGERMISLALKELLRADVVSFVTKMRRRYYRINPRFHLYHELEDLAVDRNLREDEVSRCLKKLPNLKLAVLSGIFTFQPELSTDILLVGEDLRWTRLVAVLAEIEKLTGEEINYTTMDLAEYEYRRMLNDRFIRDIFDHSHLVVINNLKNKRALSK